MLKPGLVVVVVIVIVVEIGDAMQWYERLQSLFDDDNDNDNDNDNESERQLA